MPDGRLQAVASPTLSTACTGQWQQTTSPLVPQPPAESDTQVHQWSPVAWPLATHGTYWGRTCGNLQVQTLLRPTLCLPQQWNYRLACCKVHRGGRSSRVSALQGPSTLTDATTRSMHCQSSCLVLEHDAPQIYKVIHICSFQASAKLASSKASYY